jgi:L-fuculose-phosphate aldolase
MVVGTWGNVSARLAEVGPSSEIDTDNTDLVLSEERVLITPSGMDYNQLQVSDLALTDLEGRIIQGHRRPSTEIPLHLAIYRQRRDVRAIVHTHSQFASILAVTGLPLPPIVEELAQRLGGPVPITAYAGAGTKALAENTVKALGQGMAVLLANHGLIGVGSNLEEALMICQLVEKGAQIYTYSRMLGEPNILTLEQVQDLRDKYLNHYGQK